MFLPFLTPRPPKFVLYDIIYNTYRVLYRHVFTHFVFQNIDTLIVFCVKIKPKSPNRKKSLPVTQFADKTKKTKSDKI